MKRLVLLLALAALFFGSTLAMAQAPSMAKYDTSEMLAESKELPDLTFPSAAIELGMFSNLRNGLFRPTGGPKDLRYPALVLMHTCGGIREIETRYWLQAALDRGYVVLAVDGLRGNQTNCVFPLRVATGRRIKDAFDALHHLSGQPLVDPSKIFVAGFSQGAFIASLVSSAEVAAAFARTSALRFAASASLYGHCQYPAGSIPRIAYPIEIVRQDIDRPLLILMGNLDNETPPASCENVIPLLKSKGAPVESHIYPDGTHCWDCISLDGRVKTNSRGVQIVYRFDRAVTENSRQRMFDFFER
jgi:dienelactone hydrolase